MAEQGPAVGQQGEPQSARADESPAAVAKRHEQMRVLEKTAASLAEAEVDPTGLRMGPEAVRAGNNTPGMRHRGAGRAGTVAIPRDIPLKGNVTHGTITPLMVATSIHKTMNAISARMVTVMDNAVAPDDRKDARTELLLLFRLRGILGRQLHNVPSDVALCDAVLAFVQQLQHTLNDLQQGGIGRLHAMTSYLRELVNELAMMKALEPSAQAAFKTRLRELNAQLDNDNPDVELLTSHILGVAELTQALWEKHCLVSTGSWLEDAVRQR